MRRGTRHTSSGWPAPAKINLYLHVLGRRADGYHEIQTAFQFLDWQDVLEFRELADGAVSRTGWGGVGTDEDLTVRAARSLQEKGGVRQGVEIRLTKRLPVGGGLGGGSSDAATTLVALNRLWDTRLNDDELAGLALELGADVPVFVLGRAAVAGGIGERLEPTDFPEPFYLVIDPGVTVSTAAVFRDPELTRNSAPTTIPGLLSGAGRNDCLPVVRRLYPPVARVLDWLGQYGEPRLTGTGGCVFAAFPSEEEAERVRRLVPGEWRARVARGRNRSPLLNRLEQPA